MVIFIYTPSSVTDVLSPDTDETTVGAAPNNELKTLFKKQEDSVRKLGEMTKEMVVIERKIEGNIHICDSCQTLTRPKVAPSCGVTGRR